MMRDSMLMELWLWVILSFLAFVVMALLGPLWLALLVACSLAVVGFSRGWWYYYGRRAGGHRMELERLQSRSRSSSRSWS